MSKPKNDISLELIKASYWAHHSYANELARIYPIDNPKRKMIEAEVERLRVEMNNLDK